MADLYRITKHTGSSVTSSHSSHSGTLLYTTTLENVALRAYGKFRPAYGTTIALWRPDGSLVEAKSGSPRPGQ
jgi:hypothetical protein